MSEARYTPRTTSPYGLVEEAVEAAAKIVADGLPSRRWGEITVVTGEDVLRIAAGAIPILRAILDESVPLVDVVCKRAQRYFG